MGESRTTCRYRVDIPAQLDFEGAQLACSISNLSMGGAFVIGPVLTIGTRAGLQFTAPPHMEAFRSRCTARWSSSQGTAFVFDGLRALDAYALGELLRWVTLGAGPLVQKSA
jgi:hypothetical protein